MDTFKLTTEMIEISGALISNFQVLSSNMSLLHFKLPRGSKYIDFVSLIYRDFQGTGKNFKLPSDSKYREPTYIISENFCSF